MRTGYVFCRTLVVCSCIDLVYSLVPFSNTASDQTAVTSDASVVHVSEIPVHTITQSSTPMVPSSPASTISPSQSTIICTFIVIYLHLLFIAEETSVVGAVLGTVVAVAAVLLLSSAVLAIPIFICMRRKGARTGIVHLHVILK